MNLPRNTLLRWCAAALVAAAVPAVLAQSPTVEQLRAAQPKLLRISAQVDGSGRLVFTNQHVRYVHKHWSPPVDVVFDGEPWTELRESPAAWTDYRERLDLPRAWIVSRSGRDLVALEQTAEGFDLYLSDSPNGADTYEVTVAIPRRP
jgi:hypothetical protein